MTILQLAVFCFLVLFSRPALAWVIEDFQTQAILQPDSHAHILETIAVDFSDEASHGIFRDIPIHYVDRLGQRFTMRLAVRSVTDESGLGLPYKLIANSGYLRIRIGNPDQLITGKHIYRILYEVERGAVRYFPDHDEFYWNLTGNEWAVPIARAHAEVTLPEAAGSGIRAIAYIGQYGSSEVVHDVNISGNMIRISAPRPLGPYEGLTTAVAWPKGITHPPSFTRNLKWWIEDNSIYFIPVIVFLFMFWLWSVKGKDPALSRSLTVQYEPPPGLSAAELGTLIDETVDMRDITATLIDLAVRGYLEIEPIEKKMFEGQDYRLTNLKDWHGDAELKPFETQILSGIFKAHGAIIRLSDLSERFYIHLEPIKKKIYSRLIENGYFESNPESERSGYLGIAFVVGVILGVALSFFDDSRGLWTPSSVWIVSLLTGIIVFFFGRIMPRRTLKGVQANQQTHGFMEFLKRTDEDKIKRMNDPSLFEKFLPYALAFNVANQWAAAFEGIYKTAPRWYVGNWTTFSPTRFSHELNAVSSSMGQTFTSQPRSSSSSGFGGGGFSGGGGGGGGGGRW